jgi:hypothetical protein
MRKSWTILVLGLTALGVTPSVMAEASSRAPLANDTEQHSRHPLLPTHNQQRAAANHAQPRAFTTSSANTAVSAEAQLSPNDGNRYSETAVAYDPATASSLATTHVVSGSNIVTAAGMAQFDNGTGGTGSWTAGSFGPDAGFAFTSDPGLAFDTSGNALYSFVNVGGSGTQIDAHIGANYYVVDGSAFPDKPLIAIDHSTSGTGASNPNRAYFAYDKNPSTTGCCSQPIVVSSQGATAIESFVTNWRRATVWDSGGDLGAYPAVSSNGTVYVAWDDQCGRTTPGNPTGLCPSNHGQILLAKSIDGGSTFENGSGQSLDPSCTVSCNLPTAIAQTTTGFGSILPNYGGTCASGCAPRLVVSLPSIDIDRTAGATAGDIYMVWADGADPQSGVSTVPSSQRMHIYFSVSNDGGAHWHRCVDATNAPCTGGSTQQIDIGNSANDGWQPAIAVDQSTGKVSVAWYDRRDDPNNLLYRVYYSQSVAGGGDFASATQIPVSTIQSDPTRDCNGTGDYLSITAVDGVAIPVWADTRTGTSPEGAPKIWAAQVTESVYPGVTSGSTVSGTLRNPNGTVWQPLPGSAQDIAVGPDSLCSVEVIGTDHLSGGGGVYAWDRTSMNWFGTIAGGSGVRISVNAFGDPRIINSQADIYRLFFNGSSFFWSHLVGKAVDIANGADGSLWVIGTNPVAGGFGIYVLNNSGGFTNVPGGGVRLAVGADGLPWIINSAHDIYCLDSNSNWHNVPGKAVDIGVGASGAPWVIGTNTVPGGFGIYRWNANSLVHACSGGGGFVGVDGGGTAISVGTDGLPWILNSAGSVYERLF